MNDRNQTNEVNPILALRHGPTLRTVAAITLVTFASLYLQPVAMAAHAANKQMFGFQHKAKASAEHELAATVDKIQARLKSMHERLNKNEDVTKDRDDLDTLRADLDQQNQEVMANFDAIGQRLKDKHLPAVILQRQADMVSKYKAQMKTLRSNLDAIHKAKDDSEREALTQKAWQELQSVNKKRPWPKFDPNNLPIQVPKAQIRKPAENARDFEKLGFNKSMNVQLASLALFPEMLTPAVYPADPSAVDLAATDDVQITDAMRTLAKSLDNNPVKIDNWVHNNIDFVPTFGSTQGSATCLETRHCNGIDTASLLIALLRAAGIPARYVYGTIQMPAANAMNWVGGVETPEAAQDLLGKGGIANTAVVQGGQVTAIQMEHVWVEAWVDYFPSRGAVNKQGDSWIPMDPSFKQYQAHPGMDIAKNVPFDAQAMINAVQSSATIDSTKGWVKGIDANVIQTQLTDYRSQVDSYITGQKANATVGDVLGYRAIVQKNPALLAGTLPYQVLVVGGQYSALPSSLQDHVQFDLYASAADLATDDPSLTFSKPLASLAGKKIALAYKPATAADQALIDNAITSRATDLPAYLISLTPVLRVAGQSVATGSGATMGDKHLLTVTIKTPWYSRAKNYSVTAGDVSVVGVNPAGITDKVLTDRTTQYDMSGTPSYDLETEMLYQVSLAWWAEKWAYNTNISKVQDIRAYRLPSHALVTAPLTVNYLFGIPDSAYYASRTIDGKEDYLMAEQSSGQKQPVREFLETAGEIGSLLESNIFEQALFVRSGVSVSTIAALNEANSQDIPIYAITQANAATALSNIDVDADTKAEISAAVGAGMRVTVPQQQVTIGNFTGTGYIVEDPETGAGAYEITGGRSGGSSPAPKNVFPVPQTPAMSVIGMMAGSSLRSAGATLAVENGTIVGVVLPATDVAAGGAVVGVVLAPEAILLAAIALVIAIILTVNQELDRDYPKTSIRLRHYTTVENINEILGTKFIWESPTGTYGPGVYFADAIDEATTWNEGCPPDGTEVANRLEIPTPDAPDPARAARWVEVLITRANIYKIVREPPNAHGGEEIIITKPLFPTGAKDKNGNMIDGLWFADDAFGIELFDACTS